MCLHMPYHAHTRFHTRVLKVFTKPATYYFIFCSIGAQVTAWSRHVAAMWACSNERMDEQTGGGMDGRTDGWTQRD